MIRQSSWDRGDLHKSARVCWDYFVGLITCPSNKDLISAAECPQPVREGALGGGGRGGGDPGLRGRPQGGLYKWGTLRYQVSTSLLLEDPTPLPPAQHTKSTCFQDLKQLEPS